MATPGLYIFGFGGHARSVADVAVSSGIERLLFVDANARPDEAFAGFAALPRFPSQPKPGWKSFPALGDNARRRALADTLPLPMATLLAPTASLGIEATVEDGAFIAHHAHIGPAAHIGRGAIVNSGAVVDHETTIGAFTHISVNAAIAGRCSIGANVMIGAGAVVIDGIRIADAVIVGAGATVVSDILTPGTYVGTPARLLART